MLSCFLSPSHFRRHAFLLLICLASPIFAKGEDDEDLFPTAEFFLDAAYLTQKSALLKENDTAIQVNLGFAFNAGSDRTVGIIFKRDSSTTSFVQSGSRFAPVFQDGVFRYRWGGFYLGLVVSSATLTITQASADLATITANGFGGNLGYKLARRNGAFHTDITYTSYPTAQELEQKVVTLGPKMDADLGLDFDLTRSAVDFT